MGLGYLAGDGCDRCPDSLEPPPRPRSCRSAEDFATARASARSCHPVGPAAHSALQGRLVTTLFLSQHAHAQQFYYCAASVSRCSSFRPPAVLQGRKPVRYRAHLRGHGSDVGGAPWLLVSRFAGQRSRAGRLQGGGAEWRRRAHSQLSCAPDLTLARYFNASSRLEVLQAPDRDCWRSLHCGARPISGRRQPWG